MEKLFSDQKVNSGRQPELDLAKCSSIIFMIFLHCYFAMSYFAFDISLFLERGIAQLVGGPFAANENKKALVWTVNDKSSQKYFLSSDVDGIITDHITQAAAI